MSDKNSPKSPLQEDKLQPAEVLALRQIVEEAMQEDEALAQQPVYQKLKTLCQEMEQQLLGAGQDPPKPAD